MNIYKFFYHMRKTLFLFIMLFCSSFVNADFVKVSLVGEVLDVNSSSWDCVFDDKTNLYWEVKKNEEGTRYKDNTYTWYDGVTGHENNKYSRNCDWGDSCNTNNYITKINKNGLCSFKDWRLPSFEELQTLLFYYDENSLVDLDFFPNNKSSSYWTKDEVNNNNFIAYEFPFLYGGSILRDKYFDTHIRLVRSDTEKKN